MICRRGGPSSALSLMYVHLKYLWMLEYPAHHAELQTYAQHMEKASLRRFEDSNPCEDISFRIFLYLPGYGGGSEATGAFFFLNTYGGFLRWRIWATYSFFSIQHAFIDFECFCAFLCKV